MEDRQNKRLTDAELHVFFDRLFPHGLAGADVLADVAPGGWKESPLLACFHPSVEQMLEESVRLHGNIEAVRSTWKRRDTSRPDATPSAEPTLAEIRARGETMDRPLPATVRGYRQMYGRDPRGWPPR